MNKLYRKICFALIAMFALTGFAEQATAQTRRTEAQTRQLVQRIKTQGDNLRTSIDLAIQNVRLRGTEQDNINNYLQEFETAATQYEDRFEAREAAATDVQDVLDAAAKINVFLQQTNLGSRVNRDWSSLKLSLTQLSREYGIAWNPSNTRSTTSNYPNNQNNPTNSTARNNPSNNSLGIANTRLNGTFQLDSSRSDDAREVAARAVRALPFNQREEARQTLEQRLDTPEVLAIEQRSNQITIASTRAPRYTFEADGRDKVETTGNNTTLRVRTTLAGERLEVMTSGDRGNDYTVTFEPIEAGRALRVERRLITDFLRQPVVLQSFYTRSSDIAQLDIYERPTSGNVVDNRFPQNDNRPVGSARNNDFIVPNNTQIRATLNEALSTKTANDNDRFTMTVQTPAEFKGAIIEGYVTGLNRSGRVTGRAQMTFNFERIRLQNGRTYNFSGFVDSFRNNNGEEVKVGDEGNVQGGNQGKQTATRAAVGTAVGALIGAIAGGGKGAAIGAIVGAGAGAGSVYVEGREDLELMSGSDVYIRATAPERRASNR